MKRLLCLIGLHAWAENPEVVKGYAKQDMISRGCKRHGCLSIQLKEGKGKWKKPDHEKFTEWLFGASNLSKIP